MECRPGLLDGLPGEMPDTELADLKSERARLIARLTEIDAKLAQIDQ